MTGWEEEPRVIPSSKRKSAGIRGGSDCPQWGPLRGGLWDTRDAGAWPFKWRGRAQRVSRSPRPGAGSARRAAGLAARRAGSRSCGARFPAVVRVGTYCPREGLPLGECAPRTLAGPALRHSRSGRAGSRGAGRGGCAALRATVRRAPRTCGPSGRVRPGLGVGALGTARWFRRGFPGKSGAQGFVA